MSRIHRRVAVTALVAITALSLAACGSRPTGSGGDSSGGFSAWGLTGGTTEAVMKQSFASWNTANASTKVTAQFFANDAYKEKIRTAVGSGNAPTLIYSWAGGTLKDYVANKNVIDLTGKLSGLESRLVPSVVATGKVDGKLYAVPNNNAQPVEIFYNKDLFDKAGIAEAPKTYADMLTDVAKLKKAGVETPIALAGQSVWPELMWLEYLTDRVGGPEAFQAVIDGKAGAWQNPAIVEALTKIQELVDAGAFGDKYGSVVADASADIALVHTGKAAMVLQGAWVYGSFLTDAPDFVKSGKLGYATFPAVDGGKGDAANIVGNPANFWSISASAPKAAQETALKYLNTAMFDKEYVDGLVKAGSVPVTADAGDLVSGDPFLSFTYGLVKDAPSFQLSWDQALAANQAQALLTNLSQVFLKQQTPQQFVTNMESVK